MGVGCSTGARRKGGPGVLCTEAFVLSHQMPDHLKFVRREREAEEVASVLLSARHSAERGTTPQLCLLAQQPGSGKTSFVRALPSLLSDPELFDELTLSLPEEPLRSLASSRHVLVDLAQLPAPTQQSSDFDQALDRLAALQDRPSGADTLVQFDNLEALASPEYDDYFGGAGTRDAVRYHRMFCAAARMYREVKGIHVVLCSSSHVPAVLSGGRTPGFLAGAIQEKSLPYSLRHVVLDPLFPSDIRRACVETLLLFESQQPAGQTTTTPTTPTPIMDTLRRPSLLEALQFGIPECEIIFEYTGGVPLAVEQALGMLWLLRAGKFPAEIPTPTGGATASLTTAEHLHRDQRLFREIMATRVAPQLTADGFCFAPMVMLPLSSERPARKLLLALAVLKGLCGRRRQLMIDLSEPLLDGLPVAYWLDEARIFLARSNAAFGSRTLCDVTVPSALLSHLVPACGATLALPEWQADPHDPARAAEGAILRALGRLRPSTTRETKKTFGEVYYFLRGSVLENVPFFCDHKPVLLDLLPPSSDLCNFATKELRLPLGQQSAGSLGAVLSAARMYVVTREDGDTEDTLPQCYSQWYPLLPRGGDEPDVVGLPRVKAEIDTFGALLKAVAIDRRNLRGLLVLISLKMSDRLAELCRDQPAGALLIPPGTHGVNKKTGKLSILNKKQVDSAGGAQLIIVPNVMEVVVLGREGLGRLLGTDVVETLLSAVPLHRDDLLDITRLRSLFPEDTSPTSQPSTTTAPTGSTLKQGESVPS